MSHLPRLHPDDLQELGKMITTELRQELKELIKESIVNDVQGYTAEDVAKMVNKHKVTVVRHIKAGLLRATKVGQSWYISQEALNEYINAI